MSVDGRVIREIEKRKLLRERIGWLVAALWLGGVGGALGYFAFKDQRAFEPVAVSLFDAQSRSRAAEDWFRARSEPAGPLAAVTVVTVARPKCSCNRYTARHVAELSERYSQAGVRFLEIEPPAELPWLDAAPAALVFDASGALAYFGPHSSSAWCGLDGGLVEPVLEGLLQGERPRPEPFYGSGCFCGGVSI